MDEGIAVETLVVDTEEPALPPPPVVADPEIVEGACELGLPCGNAAASWRSPANARKRPVFIMQTCQRASRKV